MSEQSPNIDVFGVDELNEFFAGMERSDQRRVILDAFRLGGKPLIDSAKSLIRARVKRKSKKQNLYKSIGFVPLAKRNSVFVSAKIGARRFGNFKGYHGHFFNNGTAMREYRGFSLNKSPASNFFDDALQATESQMIDASQQHILEALEKFINKTLPKRNNL